MDKLIKQILTRRWKRFCQRTGAAEQIPLKDWLSHFQKNPRQQEDICTKHVKLDFHKSNPELPWELSNLSYSLHRVLPSVERDDGLETITVAQWVEELKRNRSNHDQE